MGEHPHRDGSFPAGLRAGVIALIPDGGDPGTPFEGAPPRGRHDGSMGAGSSSAGMTRARGWAWVALACLGLFLLLAALIVVQGTLAFDGPFTAFVQGWPVPTDAWLFLTSLGGFAILAIIGTAVVLALAIRHRTREAVAYGLAIIGASLWTSTVKVAIARPRPPGPALADFSGFSFPSGHTLNSTVTYGLIGLLVWRTRWPRWVRAIVVLCLAGLVALIGCSRIALGVHYPSDVLGGWLAGLAVVATVAAFTAPDRAREAAPVTQESRSEP